MAEVGISDGNGKSRRIRPWRNKDGSHRLMEKNHAVVILGFDPEGDKPVQMDFVGLNKPESVKEYLGKVTDWAGNDLNAYKGTGHELWWVYVTVDTKTMKPTKFLVFHDGRKDAIAWGNGIKDKIRQNPLATLTEVRGKGPWADLFAAPEIVAAGKPRKIGRNKLAPASAQAAPDKPVRRIRKPKAAPVAAA